MGRSNSIRLTDMFIRSLKPPERGNVRYTDSEVPGFVVRITTGGSIAFVLDYRPDDRNRRGTIVRWPEYNAGAAGDKAINFKITTWYFDFLFPPGFITSGIISPNLCTALILISVARYDSS